MYIVNQGQALREKLRFVAVAMISVATVVISAKLFSLACDTIPAAFAGDMAGIGIIMSFLCGIGAFGAINLSRWAVNDGLKLGLLAMYAWSGKEIFNVRDERDEDVYYYMRARILGLMLAIVATGFVVNYQTMGLASQADGRSLSIQVELQSIERASFVLALVARIFLVAACVTTVVILAVEIVAFVTYKLALRRVEKEQKG